MPLNAGTRWRVPAALAGLAILVLFGLVMALLTIRQDRLISIQEYQQAKETFDFILLARAWNAGYNGVFVEKRKGVASNPYLESPDIKAVGGATYTLKTPSAMTRELSELSGKFNGITFRISSLKPLNPVNKPDGWERRALEAFEKGQDEVVEQTLFNGRPTYRFMRPLRVEESCLKCHAEQGYKLGEVRGGISVNRPADEELKGLRSNMISMLLLSLLVGGLFVLILYIVIWHLFERLALANEQLTQLNTAKDRFLGMAAHDLRNPLAVIIAGASALEDHVAADPYRSLLESMASSARKMFGLISDLLDVNKISTGHLVLRLAPVDVGGLAREAAVGHELIAGRKGIAIEAAADPAAGTAVLDADRVRQVLDNLVSNALKFSHAGSRVIVGAARRDGMAVLWVQDQGVGIKPENLSKLFGDFSKAGAVPTGGEASYGLGLAISKRLVDLHKGRITVESEPGKGSKFTVLIPADLTPSPPES